MRVQTLKSTLQVQSRLPTLTSSPSLRPLPLVGPPKWETLNCPVSQEPSGAREGIELLEKVAPLLPPSSLTLGGAPGGSRHRHHLKHSAAEGPRSEVHSRSHQDPRLPNPLAPLPPTCQSRPASWQPLSLSLLARSPPGARSASSSPRSRPPGHSPPRTPSGA